MKAIPREIGGDLDRLSPQEREKVLASMAKDSGQTQESIARMLEKKIDHGPALDQAAEKSSRYLEETLDNLGEELTSQVRDVNSRYEELIQGGEERYTGEEEGLASQRRLLEMISQLKRRKGGNRQKTLERIAQNEIFFLASMKDDLGGWDDKLKDVALSLAQAADKLCQAKFPEHLEKQIKWREDEVRDEIDRIKEIDKDRVIR